MLEIVTICYPKSDNSSDFSVIVICNKLVPKTDFDLLEPEMMSIRHNVKLFCKMGLERELIENQYCEITENFRNEVKVPETPEYQFSIKLNGFYIFRQPFWIFAFLSQIRSQCPQKSNNQNGLSVSYIHKQKGKENLSNTEILFQIL